MSGLDRRTALVGTGAAALTLLGGNIAQAAAASSAAVAPKVVPSPTNPCALRIGVVTVVTPDIGASLHLYRDLLGYELVREGKLGSRLPDVAGIGGAGRKYALLHARGVSPLEFGALRLLEAPAGAAPNRPRPGSQLTDPGLATFQLMTRDDVLSHRTLSQGGARTISGPEHYGFRDPPTPGVIEPEREIEVTSYSVFGPADEQFYITKIYSLNGDANPGARPAGHMARTPDALHGAFQGCSITCLDRWPVWDFYQKAFGLTSTRDTNAEQEGLNKLVGLPADAYWRFGIMGEGTGIEVWEFRRFRPPGRIYPQALDRTGFAMVTFSVDDLDRVRSNIRAAGITPIGAGALPTVTAEHQDGLYLRGAVGELIEVIGRQA